MPTPLSEWQTGLENRMEEALKEAGIYAIPQFPAQGFIIDFAILLEDGRRIAIECDGKRWHSSPKQRRRDGWKNHCLIRSGWTVTRFTGNKIENDMPGCIGHIRKLLVI